MSVPSPCVVRKRVRFLAGIANIFQIFIAKKCCYQYRKTGSENELCLCVRLEAQRTRVGR